MVFDLGEFVNNLSNWFLNDSIFSSILLNPIGATVIIMLIIVLILFINYKTIIKDNNAKAAKSTVYMFITVLVMTFLHYKALNNHVMKQYDEKSGADMIKKIEQKEGGIVPFQDEKDGVIDIVPMNVHSPSAQQGQANAVYDHEYVTSRHIPATNEGYTTHNDLGGQQNDLADVDFTYGNFNPLQQNASNMSGTSNNYNTSPNDTQVSNISNTGVTNVSA